MNPVTKHYFEGMCDGELKLCRFNFSYQLFVITLPTEKVDLILWDEIFSCHTSAGKSGSS